MWALVVVSACLEWLYSRTCFYFSPPRMLLTLVVHQQHHTQTFTFLNHLPQDLPTLRDLTGPISHLPSTGVHTDGLYSQAGSQLASITAMKQYIKAGCDMYTARGSSPSHRMSSMIPGIPTPPSRVFVIHNCLLYCLLAISSQTHSENWFFFLCITLQ